MILPNTVSVTRISNGAVDPAGAPIDTPTVVIKSMKADVQPEGGQIVQPLQGQVALYDKKMFCYPADIRANDIITDLSTGEKMKVVNVNSYSLLKHMEIALVGGVT